MTDQVVKSETALSYLEAAQVTDDVKKFQNEFTSSQVAISDFTKIKLYNGVFLAAIFGTANHFKLKLIGDSAAVFFAIAAPFLIPDWMNAQISLSVAQLMKLVGVL